jgi:hypothetical protein
MSSLLRFPSGALCFLSPLGFSLGQNPKLLTRPKLQFSLVLRSVKVEIK